MKITLKDFGAASIPVTYRDILEELRVKAGVKPKSEPESESRRGISEADSVYHDTLPFPYGFDPKALADLFFLDPTHHACCVLKARALGASNWRVVRRDGRPAKPPKALLRYLEEVFPEGLEAIVYPVALDFEAVGNGYIEVVRTLDARFRRSPARVAGLVHVPAFTVRRLVPGHRTGCSFVQIYNTLKIFFREFGELEPQSLDDPPQTHVTELVHIKNHIPTSAWYGLPDIVAALPAVAGAQTGQDYLSTYLSAKGIPSYFLFLKGGDAYLDKLDEATLNRYYNEALEVGAGKIVAMATPEGIDVQLERVSLHASLPDTIQYVREARYHIARVHNVPPAIINLIEDRTSSATEAIVQAEQFKQLVVRPRQRMWENILYRALFAGHPEWRNWKIEFREIDFQDIVRRMQADTGYLRSGVYTINEVRASQGLPPVEGGERPIILAGGEPTPLDLFSVPEAKQAEEGWILQSLLLSKERFETLEEARQWAEEHGYETDVLFETSQYWRFRQIPPQTCEEETFRTVEIEEGVKGIYCVPRVPQKHGTRLFAWLKRGQRDEAC